MKFLTYNNERLEGKPIGTIYFEDGLPCSDDLPHITFAEIFQNVLDVKIVHTEPEGSHETNLRNEKDQFAALNSSATDGYSFEAVKEASANSRFTEANFSQPLKGQSRQLFQDRHGLRFVVENAKGSTRTGYKEGKPWSVVMPADYGYVSAMDGGELKNGADGDGVDCWLGETPSDTVYIIDQRNLETGEFDEHKCFVDFASESDAVRTYMDAYKTELLARSLFMGVKTMSMPDFKQWLTTAKTKVQAANSMPQSANRRAAAIQVLRGCALAGVGKWIEQQVSTRFRELEADLLKLVQAGGDADDLSTKGGWLIGDAFEDVDEVVFKTMRQLAETLSVQSGDALHFTHDIKNITPAVASPNKVLVGGLSIMDNLDKLESDFALRFKAAIQLGAKAGETPEQMAQRIVKVVANEQFANAGLGAIERLLDATEGGFSKLIQSAVQVIGRDADQMIAEINAQEDSNMGWQWVAVLDERVCERCASLDGSRWTSDWEPETEADEEFEDDPPLHPNCRCQLVPVNLDEPAIVETPKLDKFLNDHDSGAIDAVYGDSAGDAYRRGELTSRQLVATGKALSPDEFAGITEWLK